MIIACLLYTARVLVAWWLIKQIREWISTQTKWSTWAVFYFSVFIGAEITFIIDYFIFKELAFG